MAEPSRTSQADSQPTFPSRSARANHRAHGSGSRHSHSQIVRVLFFSAAAAWGFVVGVGALALAHRGDVSPVRVDAGTAMILGLALVVAIVGAGVMAAAYRSNRHHHRS